MRYIVSDIHGCYEEYKKLLEKIQFSERDELYVLGDVVDRGKEPIKVLQDMMSRENVTYILGNHDFIMFQILSKLMAEITEENCENYLKEEDLLDYICWIQDGGKCTQEQFCALTREEQREILEYIEDALVYEVLEDKGKRYVLVHAGLHDFSEEKELDEYNIGDFLFFRADYKSRYFKDENTYLVTGHTPTMCIREDKRPEIYCGNGHIAVDCGCVFGGRLAAYCIETGKKYYVECIQ